MTKLFFATDIHGSDICWDKFLTRGNFTKQTSSSLAASMTGNDYLDEVDVIVCVELAQLIPGNLEMPI